MLADQVLPKVNLNLAYYINNNIMSTEQDVVQLYKNFIIF